MASGEEKYTHATGNRTPIVQPVANNSMNIYTSVYGLYKLMVLRINASLKSYMLLLVFALTLNTVSEYMT